MLLKDITEKEKTKEDYRIILSAFHRLIDWYGNSAERWDLIEDIITLRASFLIDRALTGLKIDFDRALGLIRNHNEFTTQRERQERDILLAAIDNLIDFAAAQEYTMIEELPDEIDSDQIDEYDSVCDKYNLRYAEQENSDVVFAAGMAAWFLNLADETLVTFMTQGDERVRPWHLSHEGLSFPKNNFPPELIPPIEWGCRCYLITNGFGSVYGKTIEGKNKIKVNPVFCESLAKGGKIFSSAHPYFKTNLPDEVKQIVKKLKEKFQ